MKGLEFSLEYSNIKFKFQDVGVERPSISRTLAWLGSNWLPQESGLLANGVYLNEAKDTTGGPENTVTAMRNSPEFQRQ
jgi:hypothetical protein